MVVENWIVELEIWTTSSYYHKLMLSRELPATSAYDSSIFNCSLPLSSVLRAKSEDYYMRTVVDCQHTACVRVGVGAFQFFVCWFVHTYKDESYK